MNMAVLADSLANTYNRQKKEIWKVKLPMSLHRFIKGSSDCILKFQTVTACFGGLQYITSTAMKVTPKSSQT